MSSVCIHQLFEEQVRRQPDSIAAVCESQSLTYAQLNARANQIAHYLRERKVERGTRVGICVERGLQTAAGILGILKAGGAWLPLDPQHPTDRIQRVLDDARPALVLAESATQSRLPEHGAEVLPLDEAWDSISGCSASNLSSSGAPLDIAYAMYTSGSSGQPKGVLVAHANLSHYVRAIQMALSVSAADVYLHTATFAFSSSVRQLFVPLTCGATVVIARTQEISRPLSLFQRIKDERVTVLDFVPSYWRKCVDDFVVLEPRTRTRLLENSVRLVATASEPLLSDLPRKWREELGHGAQLINMFGQTETTGIVATYTIPPNEEPDSKTVPIGRPIANTQIYLLDSQQRSVPVGAIGEIYVGGPGVSQGYLNRPELTAEVFVPDPFHKSGGRPLYKTGDLGRYRPDGNIEFLGRIDDQVKIRGVRVEPGEVAAALTDCPQLKESIVVVGKDEFDNRMLVAYVVPKERQEVAVGTLRAILSKRLPEHMIPSSFVVLDALPRLLSGKVDRRALPKPDHSRPRLDEPFVAPRTPTEQTLVAMWQTVLAVVAVGVTDNFFDLGGNSLSALSLLGLIQRRLGWQLPLATIYQAPTIRQLAALIGQGTPQSSSSLVPLRTEGSRPPFFWIHGEVSDALLPGYLGPDQPIYARGHQARDGKPAQHTTVEDMAAHYLAAIRGVQQTGPYHLGGYCFGGLVAFEMAQQLKAAGEDVRLLVLIEPSPLRNCGASCLTGIDSERPPEGKGIRQNALRHLGNLKELEWRQQLTYVGSRVAGTLAGWIRRPIVVVERALKSAVCAVCIRYGYDLPVSVRSFYILRIYRRAREKYTLRTYPGSVKLFVQRAEHDSPSNWDGLATEGVEVYEIASNSHTGVLKQPHLRIWAEKLKTMLEPDQPRRLREITSEKPAGLRLMRKKTFG